MSISYSNLPPVLAPGKNSADSVVHTFNNFYQSPVQLNASVVSAMTGFFENKGFDPTTAQSLTLTIMSQSLQDNINPMTVIDSLSGFDSAALSTLATAILNHNRYKTSYLGVGTQVTPVPLVNRNIVA